MRLGSNVVVPCVSGQQNEAKRKKRMLALKLTISTMSMTGDVQEVIPTGSLGLDAALGVGGLPRGRITEIYGPESSGKTSICLHVIAEAQKMGGTCTFIDAEHALDIQYAQQSVSSLLSTLFPGGFVPN